MRVGSTFAILAATAALATSGAAQTTAVSGFVRIGAPMNVAFTSTVGDGYLMFLSAPSPSSIPVPGVANFFLLDPALFFMLYTSNVPGSGTDTVPVPIPNDPSMVGASIELQPLDIGAGFTLAFGLNDVAVTFGSFGTIVPMVGTISSIITGDFQMQKMGGSLVATNQAPLANATLQAIRHYGQGGTVEGYAATFTNTTGNSDISTFRRDRVSRRLLTINGGTIALPNGYDVTFMRDKLNVKINYIVSINQATGTTQVLGTYTDSLRTATTSVSEFQAQVGFTDDGALMCVSVRDTANAGAASAITDKCWLVRTDGSNWTTSGTPVLDISVVAPPVGFQIFDQTIVMANGRLFVGCNYGWFTATYADSPANTLQSVTFPNLGTGRPNVFIFSVARHLSADRTRFVVAVGADTTGSLKENDLFSITGISGAGYTVQNMTGFPTATTIQQLGLSSVTQTAVQAYNATALLFSGTPANSSNGIKGAFSPDGTKYAFLTGSDGFLVSIATPPYTPAPANLFIAATDGSQAGTLVSPTAGQFDPQVNYMSDIAFVNNDTVVFFAGKWAYLNNPTTPSSVISEVALDLYSYTISSNTITNLTRTATGSLVAPFTAGGTAGNVRPRSTFYSGNGAWWYFERGFGPQVTAFANNLVGLNTATLALRDITGSEFSGGTAPAIYRGVSTTGTTYTTDPWASLELSVRRSPVGNLAYFNAENATGASATVFNDMNIFAFDMENGGPAVQLTSYAGSGTNAAVRAISQLNISPDGTMLAWAQRLGATVEEVFAMPSPGGTPRQLSLSRFGATAQSVTDGSIHWTTQQGGVWRLVWAVGTGSTNVPVVNAVAQTSLVNVTTPAPIDITAAPVTTPAKAIMIINGNSSL